MTIFTDRYGVQHTPPEGAIIRPRAGAFSACTRQFHLLLVWPAYAPLTPELPGGGVDPGESLYQANAREFWEETGYTIDATSRLVRAQFKQHVEFYAEDVNEYWHYSQTFFHLNTHHGVPMFDGFLDTPEQGRMAWISFTELSVQPINVMHKRALVALGIL